MESLGRKRPRNALTSRQGGRSMRRSLPGPRPHPQGVAGLARRALFRFLGDRAFASPTMEVPTMRHLRSLALSLAALACFVPAQAFASQARIDGLGLQSDYVQDYVNVVHYPSTIVRYQNLVYGDLGIKDASGGDLSDFEDNEVTNPALENSARSMGTFLKLWKGMPGVFGVQLNENANPF